MKRWIRCLALLLGILMMLSMSVFADTEIVKPTEQLYVSDYANILSAETETAIVEQVTALKSACGGEIAVVTIDFLNDLDSEEYAYEILNQWGVGDARKNNGMVMLLVPGEGKGWITVGTGLEDYISAGTLESIMNAYLWDDFDAGRYDQAVTNTVAQLLGQYESYYGIQLDGALHGTGSTLYDDDYSADYNSDGEYGDRYAPSFLSRVFRGLGKLIILIVIFALFFGVGTGRRGRGSYVPWIWFGHHHHHRPPRDPWDHDPHGPRGPRGPRGPHGPGGFGGGFGGGGFHGGSSGGGSFGGGGGRGGGAGRR